jgi:hypothetical protein
MAVIVHSGEERGVGEEHQDQGKWHTTDHRGFSLDQGLHAKKTRPVRFSSASRNQPKPLTT